MNYNLKTFDTIKWLRNRYKSRVKDQYILYESELKEQNMMKAVFNSIDRDKSKFLDRSELYDMFIKYGININKSKLKEFFKSIDEDEDDKLNWTDFKQALKNQEALNMFVQLMKKIREDYEINKIDPTQLLTFVPLSFPQMIQYMNYCVLREEIIDKIESENINNYQKHKQCVNLLTLEDNCYRNIKQNIADDNDSEDEIKNVSKIDHSQLLQMKRFQERELKFKRLEKVIDISKRKFYSNPTQDLGITDNVRLSNITDIKVNLSQEINKTRENVDKFLAILNNEKLILQKSRQASRVSSRQRSREKKNGIFKKNTILVEAEKELFNASAPQQNKFKILNSGSLNKQKYPRERILSLNVKYK
ncbi:unnamed protein product (macronuclear) [Paramecium tetraurelia]|uniref:EF-hand domain-containing protein n=1 Tax=Paramecium tetraurelia TaxID=5888 RepID=A0EAR5_PARTE|nr:uncharacterized protein GSPATT00025116001 [Paramecium tetraurelia]CAK92382.1 unnamed protein product [Paramecium tetraurelia]|eukprot:XP_001459779.1 hypothetical protein (macronuclear) [Paramecium tetraurelia strain d4-2]